LKLDQVKQASDELDIAETKELAYKALRKIGLVSLKIGQEVSKSQNVKLIAKDLAVISVNVLDKASDVYSQVKDVSSSMSEDVFELDDSQKNKIVSEDK